MNVCEMSVKCCKLPTIGLHRNIVFKIEKYIYVLRQAPPPPIKRFSFSPLGLYPAYIFKVRLIKENMRCILAAPSSTNIAQLTDADWIHAMCQGWTTWD